MTHSVSYVLSCNYGNNISVKYNEKIYENTDWHVTFKINTDICFNLILSTVTMDIIIING